GAMAGCMAGGPAVTAQDHSGAAATTAQDHSGSAAGAAQPLILDLSDLRLGTTVQFQRIPTASEINDLHQGRALAHLVLTLSEWPTDLNATSALAQAPEQADVIVILPGYPPSRGAGELWNY